MVIASALEKLGTWVRLPASAIFFICSVASFLLCCPCETLEGPKNIYIYIYIYSVSFFLHNCPLLIQLHNTAVLIKICRFWINVVIELMLHLLLRVWLCVSNTQMTTMIFRQVQRKVGFCFYKFRCRSDRRRRTHVTASWHFKSTECSVTSYPPMLTDTWQTAT